jgi:hypothetical protein
VDFISYTKVVKALSVSAYYCNVSTMNIKYSNVLVFLLKRTVRTRTSENRGINEFKRATNREII